MEPGPGPDLNIVLLGKTGVGKSATGNTILGRPAFESRLSLKSVTTKISEATGRVFEKHIRVIDTPGILDTQDTQEDIRTVCQNLLRSSTPCLFLIVVRVGRFTREDQKAVRMAMKATRSKGLKKSYLLFTGGDILKTSLEDFIFEDDEGELPGVVRRMTGAYHLFNNETQDQEQVRSLLWKSGHLGTSVLPSEPIMSKARRIFLLGRPGAGKSSSGNTILGRKRFKSGCGFKAVSSDCVSKSAIVEGREVTVVDTPGFTDEVQTPKQLYMEIMRTLVEASPGPHAFVIVVKLDRINQADTVLFEALTTMFNSDASKYSMVLFTGGDQLEGQSIDQVIQSSSCVSELVSMCGGRYCVFDNSQTGNRQQVRNLLNQVDKIVTDNGGEHYTSDMFEMAERFINEERNQLHEGSYSGTLPEGSYSGTLPEGSYSGTLPEGSYSGTLPEGSASVLGRVWEKIKRFLEFLWDKVCNKITEIIETIRNTKVRFCGGKPPGDNRQETSRDFSMTPQSSQSLGSDRESVL